MELQQPWNRQQEQDYVGVKYGTGRHESTLPIAESHVAIKVRYLPNQLATPAKIFVSNS